MLVGWFFFGRIIRSVPFLAPGGRLDDGIKTGIPDVLYQQHFPIFVSLGTTRPLSHRIRRTARPVPPTPVASVTLARRSRATRAIIFRRVPRLDNQLRTSSRLRAGGGPAPPLRRCTAGLGITARQRVRRPSHAPCWTSDVVVPRPIERLLPSYCRWLSGLPLSNREIYGVAVPLRCAVDGIDQRGFGWQPSYKRLTDSLPPCREHT